MVFAVSGYVWGEILDVIGETSDRDLLIVAGV